MFNYLGYNKNEVLVFNNKRPCGLWFCIIGVITLLAVVFGGDFAIHPAVFAVGYVGGYAIAFSKKMTEKLGSGQTSAFQDKIGNWAIVLMMVIIFVVNGPVFFTMDWRRIWLGALLAAGIHLFPFYYVHGKSMLLCGLFLTINAFLGLMLPDLPFILFGFADGLIKIGFGVYLLFFSRVTSSREFLKVG